MNTQAFFERFDRHSRLYACLLVFAYVMINNTINATSDWMEATRDGRTPHIELWEPFVWEYTSAISTFILIPLLFLYFQRFPLSFHGVLKQVGVHFAASVAFSFSHTGLMVGLRKLAYATVERGYDFGNLSTELLYEYRKDAWGYLLFMVLYHGYQFIYSRLKGEAKLIYQQPSQSLNEQSVLVDEPANDETLEAPEHLLVKKLDKEFLVKVEDIDWLESSGNYVNLHCQGRIYPLRATLKGLLSRLDDSGFCRVHRSAGVNINKVASIAPNSNGDATILLSSGSEVVMSRRYRDEFKQRVS
jgi:hypothetical protein